MGGIRTARLREAAEMVDLNPGLWTRCPCPQHRSSCSGASAPPAHRMGTPAEWEWARQRREWVCLTRATCFRLYEAGGRQHTCGESERPEQQDCGHRGAQPLPPATWMALGGGVWLLPEPSASSKGSQREEDQGRKTQYSNIRQSGETEGTWVSCSAS